MHPQTYRNNFREASNEEYLLYGKTLMLWGFAKGSPLKNDFPVYFERECQISNPKKLQYQLLLNNYLEPAPARMVLASYKIQDLKIIADSIGCPKSRKKNELIDRINECLDADSLQRIVSKSNLYVLSEKGKSFLQANDDYVELHRHANYNISLYDFNKNRFPDNRRKRTFNDNVYTLVNERIYQNCSHCYYHMMEYDYMTLYEIALSEHLYDIALDNCLRSLYLKSCCMQIAQYYSTDFYHSDCDFEHVIICTAQNAARIAELGQFFNLSFIINIYNDLSLPPSFLTEEEFAGMVTDMIESTIFDSEKYNQLVISRLKKYSKL